MLADGTRITRKTGGSAYRDSLGRARLELHIPTAALTGVDLGDLGTMIFLFDPASSTEWFLMKATKTAMKTALPGQARGIGDAGLQDQLYGFAGEEKPEKLGEQVIEGEKATGTRYKRVIPAGQIGNDQPLEMVTERWDSIDLHMLVLLRRSDPVSGVKTLKVQGIRHTEPEAALFRVPEDYSVTETPVGANVDLGPPRQP
jgi:hypothetical protein